jgi:hypothetical protein
MEISPVEQSCMRTDRHDEANSRFFAILRTRLVICWYTYRPWICAAVTARCDDRAKHKFGVSRLVQHLVDRSNGRAKRQHVSGGLQATPDRRNVRSHAVGVKPRGTAERSRRETCSEQDGGTSWRNTNCWSCRATDWAVRGSTSGRQTGCRAHTATYLMCVGGKAAGTWSSSRPLPNAEAVSTLVACIETVYLFLSCFNRHKPKLCTRSTSSHTDVTSAPDSKCRPPPHILTRLDMFLLLIKSMALCIPSFV